MFEEQYKAKCPEHIFIADTEFFEATEKKKKKYGVIDCNPPAGFQMGIVLERIFPPDEDVFPPHVIQLYITPEQYLDRCMDHETVPWQGLRTHQEGLDLTNYRILADGKQETIETGAYKVWVRYFEFYSGDGDTEKTEAIYITIGVPEQNALKRMRRMIYDLFENVKVWKKGRDDLEKIWERMSIKESGKQQDAEKQGPEYSEEGLIYVEFLYPLEGGFVPEEKGKVIDLEAKEVVQYKKEIVERAEWVNTRIWGRKPPINLMTGFVGSDSLRKKALRGDVSIKEENELYVSAVYILKEALTAEEIKELEESTLFMYSEYWSESFNPVEVEGGSLHFSSWDEPDLFIYRQIEPPCRYNHEKKPAKGTKKNTQQSATDRRNLRKKNDTKSQNRNL